MQESSYNSKTVSVMLKCSTAASSTTATPIVPAPMSVATSVEGKKHPDPPRANFPHTILLTMHESWNEDPRIDELENALNALKIKNITNVTNSTKKHLKKKGLTLASVGYNNSSGEYVVTQGPPREDGDEGEGDGEGEGEGDGDGDGDGEEHGNVGRDQTPATRTALDNSRRRRDIKSSALVKRNHGKMDTKEEEPKHSSGASEGQNKSAKEGVQNQKEGNDKKGEGEEENDEDEDEDDEEDDDDNAVSNGMLRVLEARLEHYMLGMERNGFVSSLTFVKRVTRHFVFVCHRYQGAINLQQMLMMPVVLPRTLAVSLSFFHLPLSSVVGGWVVLLCQWNVVADLCSCFFIVVVLAIGRVLRPPWPVLKVCLAH